MLIYEGSKDSSASKTERIDTRLSKEFSHSRSFFHHIITRGGVKVNGKIVKKSYQLRNNDSIEVDNIARYLSPVLLDETPDIKIPVLLEKEDYLIINKPKGVLSHPKTIRDIQEPSVVGFLYHTYKNLPSIGNFIRAGIIHRLDKNTDGLMIIAKTEKGLEHFKKLFQTKSEIALQHINHTTNHLESSVNLLESSALKKFYRATSYVTDEGKQFIKNISDFPFTIEEPVIAKIPHTMPKIGITKILNLVTSDEGLVTSKEKQEIESEKKGRKNTELVTENSSQVKISLEILTGRTHQIRYHLAHHGLPIVGDYLYGDPEETTPMQLTAYKLIFRDPEGELVTIEI